MAMSPSPQHSPVMGGSNRQERHHSNSPVPQQQLSKRDKRRTMISERLADLSAQFSTNRDSYYREQLQAIQIDMNLIMDAEAHGKWPLGDRGDEIHEIAQANKGRTLMKSVGPNLPTGSGRVYAEFVKEVNDAAEQRDTALTMHKRDYEVKLSELEATHAYRKKLAAGEHRALRNTLRDRLINTIAAKRARLARDKETTEIGESNALLLHPSQYGLTNPSSPGGAHKRPSRLRRDAEDAQNLSESNKRKRKGADSDESPAPKGRALDNGSSTPLWRLEKHEKESAQFDSPLYSIDKLFTEKELSMNYNTAALAAHSYIIRHQPKETDSPPNGKSDSSSENEKIITATGENENEDEDSPPSAVAMERQYSHATRSTRGAASNLVTGLGIDAASDLNYPGTMAALVKQAPRLPPNLPSVMQKVYVKDAANQPAGLTAEEVAAELEVIRRARAYNDERGYGKNLELEHGGKALLEAVAPQRGSEEKPSPWSYFHRGEDRTMLSNLRKELGDPEPSRDSREASEVGGTPMSRQDSRQGPGDGGPGSKQRKSRRGADGGRGSFHN